MNFIAPAAYAQPAVVKSYSAPVYHQPAAVVKSYSAPVVAAPGIIFKEEESLPWKIDSMILSMNFLYWYHSHFNY